MKPPPGKDKGDDASWFAWFGPHFGSESHSKAPADTGSPAPGAADSAADTGAADAGCDGGGGDAGGGGDGGGGGD